VGLRDEIGVDTAKIFCPKCKSVYQPPPIRSRSGHHSSNSGGGGAVDGAAFGTTFPHLFLMTFNNLVPDPLPPNSAYIPRVFGFRVHQSAHRQGGGGGGGNAFPSLPNNGRRGGSSYAQRIGNMALARAAAGVGGSRGGSVLDQVMTTGVVKGTDTGTTAAKPATLPPKLSKKYVPGNNDWAAASAEGGGGAKEKVANFNDDAGDGNSNTVKKRGKSDGGKNSGSSNENGANKNRMPKRQKRGVDVT